MKTIILALAAVISAPAFAAPVVDGNYDAAYGAAKSVVGYNPAAPNSNFGNPTNESDRIGYSIYLTSDANRVYGYLRADPGALNLTPVGSFANLYFGLNGAGSNLGFEIGTAGVRAFIPANGTNAVLSSSLFSTAASSDGLGFEFSLDNSLFTSAIAGLTYANGQVFPTTGSNVRLNLSQSFGYSVAGGAAFYGADRLGVVTIGGNAVAGVPEPATWAMMMLGFGAMGAVLRRKSKISARVRFA